MRDSRSTERSWYLGPTFFVHRFFSLLSSSSRETFTRFFLTNRWISSQRLRRSHDYKWFTGISFSEIIILNYFLYTSQFPLLFYLLARLKKAVHANVLLDRKWPGLTERIEDRLRVSLGRALCEALWRLSHLTQVVHATPLGRLSHSVCRMRANSVDDEQENAWDSLGVLVTRGRRDTIHGSTNFSARGSWLRDCNYDTMWPRNFSQRAGGERFPTCMYVQWVGETLEALNALTARYAKDSRSCPLSRPLYVICERNDNYGARCQSERKR